MAGLRGAGKVYFSAYRNSAYTGYFDLANVADMTISNSGADTKKIKSTAPTNFGAVIGSATTPGDDTVKIKLNVPNRENLLLMTLGTDTTVNVTGAVISNESVTVLAKGTWIPLAHNKLDVNVAPVVTNAAGTVTYTVDTDYTIDYTNGLIYITPASTISVGSILVDYTYSSKTGYSIAARTNASIIGKLLFVGENLDSGENIRIEAPNVELSPDGDFSLISADNNFLEFSLSGTMKVPTGGSSPYTLTIC